MSKHIKSTHNQFKKNSKKTLYKDFAKKKKDRRNEGPAFIEDVSKRLGLPADILAGAPIITATGRNEICIENYKGILEYNDKLIKVQAKLCRISIEGKHLNILYFTEDEMRITGYIQTISYL